MLNTDTAARLGGFEKAARRLSPLGYEPSAEIVAAREVRAAVEARRKALPSQAALKAKIVEAIVDGKEPAAKDLTSFANADTVRNLYDAAVDEASRRLLAAYAADGQAMHEAARDLLWRPAIDALQAVADSTGADDTPETLLLRRRPDDAAALATVSEHVKAVKEAHSIRTLVGGTRAVGSRVLSGEWASLQRMNGAGQVVTTMGTPSAVEEILDALRMGSVPHFPTAPEMEALRADAAEPIKPASAAGSAAFVNGGALAPTEWTPIP